jgi:Tol biopolymer transport system component
MPASQPTRTAVRLLSPAALLLAACADTPASLVEPTADASRGARPCVSRCAPAATPRILVTSFRDGNPEIYSSSSDPRNPDLVRLTDHPATDGHPAWNRDYTRIAFVSDRDGPHNIYAMNADGSNVVRLTTAPQGDAQPVFSPDGKQIAFTSQRDGASDIYVMDADGRNVKRLTTAPGGDVTPTWSPDGKKIAFMSGRSGKQEIWIMNAANGSAQVKFTTGAEQESDPHWSPDGQRIAFWSSHLGNSIRWRTVDGASSQTVVSGNADLQLVKKPTWSPDGQSVAYSAFTGGAMTIGISPAFGQAGSAVFFPAAPNELTLSPAWTR